MFGLHKRILVAAFLLILPMALLIPQSSAGAFGTSVLAINLAATESFDGAMLTTPFPVELRTCVDCSNCGEQGNKAFSGDEDSWFEWGLGPHPSTCYETGSCSVQHPPSCNIQFDEELLLAQLEQLRTSLAANDWHEVKALLQNTSDLIVYNVDREAIQALGCNDQVLVHFPVRASLLAE